MLSSANILRILKDWPREALPRSRPFFIMKVKWKKIVGFENYEVSNFGGVRRTKCVIFYKNGQRTVYPEKDLKFDIVRGGYSRVTLSSKNKTERFMVHRLVAEYFIENKYKKPFVNHLDGIKDNNRVSNLEWCTSSENEIHSYSILKKINPIRKLKDSDALYIRENGIKGKDGNILFLSNKYSVSRSTILNILKNRYYAIKGLPS